MRRVLVIAALFACDGGDTAPPAAPVTVPVPVAIGRAEVAPAPPTEADPPPFTTPSIRLRKSIAVRIEPSTESDKYGTIAAHTRAGYRRAHPGPGCAVDWIEIEPFGWVCGEYVEPSPKPPAGVELPRLDERSLVPGEYGKVVSAGAQAYELDAAGQLVPTRQLAGSVHVRRYGEVTAPSPQPGAGEQLYWRIDARKREYLSAADIRPHEPSAYHGVRLGDDTGRGLPLVFAVDHHRLERAVPVYRAATGGARVGTVAGRSAHPVLEIARGADGRPTAYRIGADRWLREATARLVEAHPPPEHTAAGERWIDVDLTRQTLVAYEGELPVYATLVSTGSRKNPTETGIYRVWIKFAETAMSDQMAEEPYSVATVPWTQYYSKDLALHTSYWHDGFGTRRSHGCVNLAPIDSRFLYFWSQPEVPPGWSMAHGTLARPGSLVRVRTDEVPEPPFRGLALEVWQARQASAAAARVGSP